MDSSEITTLVRDRIGDADGTIFSAAEMTRILDAAVKRYSRNRPYMKTATIATVLDQYLYTLPTDCLYPIRVWLTDADDDISETVDDILLDIRDHLWEYDEHRWREQLRERYANAGQPVAVQWNAQLYLYPPSTETGDTIHVDYAALHTKTSGDYPTIPVVDEDLVRQMMVITCLESLTTDAAKRVKYADGQGSVDPSSMARELRRDLAEARYQLEGALSETCVGIG